MNASNSSDHPLRVAVVGATGYAGGEVLRLLLQHPAYLQGKLSIGALMAGSSAGTSVAEAMPHLPQLAHREIEASDIDKLREHDVVFLGLPHGHSAVIAQQLPEETLVIDCAADFRLRNAEDWEEYYGGTYAGSWPYGIPEMPGGREAIAKSKRVAIPGCFPTGATLALWPAVASGLIQSQINVVSITGVSGGGKKASVGLLGSETMGSLKAYNTAGKHRHNPEIVQNLCAVGGKDIALSFTPVLAPLPRGILSTATALLADGADEASVRAAYEQAYADEPFVHLLPAGQQPQTQSVVGSNACHVQVEVDNKAGTVLLTSAIDNLCKGTAGAAVQCMNISLGYEETAGLAIAGVAP
ncbi:N-acetyl-gamma-glutamyl-phosphate reductase [Corynebacterium pelargi]|uniref:N-acetyl-gamma-glutamyl-phosphate reductase n=1 Tax=Corynebacterium pelargi TaxID=1471400 RepID=A0A410W952_9CORY|nr:N-acetyl-gamma-glutamyl-phosphate reductase [Corynebacterium pelargi]QAU52476.1 N-acetyl-gamma-glutamyl-phosphate reductase [Corynebacterium pelargi]GGG76690.1 N-acetyl-gamma-glutamyl-phosphate reductase [Corynebacterium pelargi]